MMDDDIFDEASEDLLVISQEWNKIARTREKDGFIAGATAGQAESLQNGFDRGFREGFVYFLLLSKLKGMLKGLLAYEAAYEGHPITDEVKLEVRCVLDAIQELETDHVVEDLVRMKLEQPQPGAGFCRDTTMQPVVAGLGSMDIEMDKCCGMSTTTTTAEEKSCCSSPGECRGERNGCAQPTNDVTGPPAPHDVINPVRVQDVLTSCPEVSSLIQRCRKIFSALNWNDDLLNLLR